MREDKYTRTLTYEALDQFLKALEPPKDFVVFQGCATHGSVKRTGLDLGLCGNPECLSCKEWGDNFHEAMKKML